MSQNTEEKKSHSQSLITQFQAIKFLVRQRLPLRGHSEDASNLIQLLKSMGEDKWIRNAHYLSPKIVNEMIELMANAVVREVIHQIHQARNQRREQ